MLKPSWADSAVFLTLALLAVAMLLQPSAFAANEARPFWTEKSAFIEGDELFVVGMASRANTAEEGRQQVFERGRIELMNYAHVSSLEAQGLVIETQMTYEETNLDGTVNVFRLIHVPADKLIAIQSRLQTQTRSQEEALEQSRQGLADVRASLSKEQKQLDVQARAFQAILDSVSQLQITLGEKSRKIEQQQKEIEQLLSRLQSQVYSQGNARLPELVSQEDASNSKPSLSATLKEAETMLDKQEQDLRKYTQWRAPVFKKDSKEELEVKISYQRHETRGSEDDHG
jgi:septal ring factor EnvC (AmiA/AmiB activator)